MSRWFQPSESPHRYAPVDELCFECKERTDTGCLRCGKPLCGAHMPERDDQRCDECEAAFQATGRDSLGPMVVWVSLAIGVIYSSVITIAMLSGATVAVLGLAGLMGAVTVTLLAPGTVERLFGEVLPRRRFLKERVRPPPQLGPGG